MVRRSSPATLAAFLGLVYVIGQASLSFVGAPLSEARAPAIQRNFFKNKPGESSLSEGDDYKMPKTPEEEAAIMKEKGFWKSEFDDLSDQEKVTSPVVLFVIAIITVPFAISAIGLIQAGVLDAD
mmetsp:Transcript_39547/g.93093  ORF Transcript_39547/g.93093 Transcript_39547/m.93093 type:complete len:125 (-) Transcript_39547:110-484(-)|eukprot:CAMPEP_0178430794 /NCGR_PEP_ID=MMETSP0689_2-20121128/31506_1 /TAXON_ID=160604 /ORGANISM="Amphidinium massartii, Strain CS-259" /LENGTH=124 /DNA_ID=CAMNT_0020052667 /DNA_START=77 /DNA_END=451 /DNA_ORIENTATION=-